MTNPLIPLAAVRAIKEEAEKTPRAEYYVHDATEYVSKMRANVPAELAEAHRTASFLASAVKSGEPWTDVCESMMDKIR